jgi:lysozyme
MKPRHQVSRAAITLIKRFEGYRRTAAQLPDGRWTIGHGHTLTARKGAEVSEDDAEALLLYDLISIAFSVNEWTLAPLTQNQFDALCSFVFNIGLDNFQRSAVLKRINQGALLQAACTMDLWRKAEFQGERIVVDALVRRRAAEKLLFLTPAADAWVSAPSPILRPLVDADALELVPYTTPTALIPSLEGEAAEVRREGPPPAPAQPAPTESPVQSAAEAVTARLQTLFADPGELPGLPDDAALTAQDESPDQLAPEPAETPFPLFAEIEAGPSAADVPPQGLEDRSQDLFEPKQSTSGEAPAPATAEPEPTIPESLRFNLFQPAAAEPAAPEPKMGLPSILFLGALGLAFFAGGLFWALNGRASPQDAVVSPLLVGWLAGIAGIGFFSIAVYLLLDRLGQAMQRPHRRRSR